MMTVLLSSKLYIPSYRSDLVARPRLIERLEVGLRGKLTLVSAPAGFGKTTLVSEWVRGCGRPVAWLSLDKNDNDLARFLTYLIAALQRIDESIGVDIQAALGESQAPHFEILLPRLVSEIEGIPEPSIMVLDDYHLIDSRSVHDALNFLSDYLPRTMHLVLVGRADPPLPISRLRVRGEVSEIRTPELRFTKGEVAAFLNDLMGLDLSSGDIAILEARTEGWVASLQLAALSMHGRVDGHEFISAFSGSHRYVIDYLVDEVLVRQPEEVRTFLRRTSILDRFCAPLCDAVVKREESGGKGILDYLDRSNLFLIPLDDHRGWYRYHNLFADFLGQRLREEELEHIPDLHRRASQWYETENLMDEAIRHALAAGDLENATRLVEQIASSLIVRRTPNLLLRWINQLPPDLCRDSPMLCIWHAWALLFLGQLEAVEPILGAAEANRDKAPRVPIHGYATTVRAYLANQMGDLHKAIDLAEQALEEMSDSSPDRITLIFRGAAVIWLGVNHRHLGDLDRARGLFVEAASLNQEAGNFYGALASFEQLAELVVIRGQLHQAVKIYRRGLQVAQRWTDEGGEGRGPSVAVSGLHHGLGTVLYLWNDLAGAAPHLRSAANLLELGEAWGSMHSYKMLAYLKQAEGDYQASIALLGKARAIRDDISVHQTNITTTPSLEQLGIMLGRTNPDRSYLLNDAALRVRAQGMQPDDKVSYHDIDFSSPSGYPLESEYSDLARALIALDRAAEALPLLDRLLEAARSMGRQGDELRYLVIQALAFHAVGRESSAQGALDQALALAERENYVRIFLDEGEPMAELLREAAARGVSSNYAARLLALFEAPIEGKGPGPEADLPSLVEPLSEREIEVLRLMAAGLKYKEVAERLVISLNTVRHHSKNVYGKLNVNSRAQAIARAVELDLL